MKKKTILSYTKLVIWTVSKFVLWSLVICIVLWLLLLLLAQFGRWPDFMGGSVPE